MRAKSNEARNPTSEHPTHAFGPVDVGQDPRQPFTLLGAHHARLDHIDGAADRGRNKPSQKRSREMRRQVILERSIGEKDPLEAIVRGQLAGRHQDRAHAVRPHAPEQAPPAFFASHAHEPVDGVLVVAPILRHERGVVLHADVEDVGGIAGDAAEEAGCAGHGDEGGEGGCREGGGEDVFEFFVDAEAGGAVGQLAEEGGGQLSSVRGTIQNMGICRSIIHRCRDRRSHCS